MFRKKFGSYIIWLLLVLYLLIIWVLVYFESASTDANIKNFWDGLWYTIITLTTVGYGDFYPVTPQGKITGLIVVLSSLGMLGYLIGNVSNKIRIYMENKRNGFYGTDFTEHFVVIGWDRFAQQVTNQIVNAGQKVVIVTEKRDEVDLIYEKYTRDSVFVLFTDLHNHELLHKANIKQSSAIYINFPDDTTSLVYILNLKKHFGDLNFVVTLDNAELRESFESIGVQNAISKNEIAARLVASYIFEPDVAQITEDLMATSLDESDYDIQEYKVKSNNNYLGWDYLDCFIDLKKTMNCVLMGISKKHNENFEVLKNPGAGTKVEEGDYLIVMANSTIRESISSIFGVSEGR